MNRSALVNHTISSSVDMPDPKKFKLRSHIRDMVIYGQWHTQGFFLGGWGRFNKFN
jgi:hypothetical protein